MKNQITKISVDKLFGYYNYDLIKSDESTDPLIILYGDNGTGKTTLLQMLTNLTSSSRNSGHKSALAQVKFEKFSVSFSNGITITAKRENEDLIGSYQVIINNGTDEDIFDVIANEHNMILTPNFIDSRTMDQSVIEKKKTLDRLLERLEVLNLSIMYLSDSRKVFSNECRYDNHELNELVHNGHYRANINKSNNTRHNNNEDDNDNYINEVISSFEKQIKNNVLSSTKIGDTNTNTIYSQLLSQVSTDNTDASLNDITHLLALLLEIKNESDNYHALGLLSKIEVDEIENAVINSSEVKRPMLYHILVPYVDLLRSRLNALKPTFDIINLFTNSINSYFLRKTISYNISTGFTIIDKFIEEPINFSDLSSGEKQLIILFCNVVNEHLKASIIIIDEPEISLNVKWQRNLIHTLLELSMGKDVQFVFSSHSIELLSSHKKSVCKLVHKDR